MTSTNTQKIHTSRGAGSLARWGADPLEIKTTLRLLSTKTTAMAQIPMNARAFSRTIRPCGSCKQGARWVVMWDDGRMHVMHLMLGCTVSREGAPQHRRQGGYQYSISCDVAMHLSSSRVDGTAREGEHSNANANRVVIKARLSVLVASKGFGRLLFVAAEGRSRWSLPPTHDRRRFNRQLRTTALLTARHRSDRAQATVPDGVAIARTQDRPV